MRSGDGREEIEREEKRREELRRMFKGRDCTAR